MDINTALQRKLKSGTKLNRYFENVSCKATFLGKGNTTFGMEQMRKWALKYQYQTKEIAKLLKQPTIAQTVSNIYKFCYDHLQYKLDSYNQNLRSPACAWKQRKQGIDCKSYSVFASTILLNLGIKHYFRKIKQPALNPENWSHVYVIVPDESNTYVIDGTLHQNTEVEFLEKQDLLMEKLPYYGLNASVVTSKIDLNNGQEWNDVEVFNGFNFLLQLLENSGVTINTINYINEKVKAAYYKNQSFKFPFKLTKNGLLVDNEIIALNYGLGATPVTTTVMGIDTNIFKNNNNTTDLATTAITSLEADPSGISSILAIATNLFKNLNIQENIQKVLKYGLDSYNAALSPESIDIKIKDIYMPIIQSYIDGIKTATTIQQFESNLNNLELSMRFYAEYGYASVNRRNWAKSTEAAFNHLSETFTQAYNNTVPAILSELRNKGFVFNEAVTNTAFGDVDHIYTPEYDEDQTTAEKNGTFAHKVYTLIDVPSESNLSNNGNVNVKTTGTISNLSKILGYGSAAAIAGFFLIPMIGKKK